MSEHQQVEWKASWRDEYLKWICGFANAQGGVLEIGKNDRGEVVGIDNAEFLLGLKLAGLEAPFIVAQGNRPGKPECLFCALKGHLSLGVAIRIEEALQASNICPPPPQGAALGYDESGALPRRTLKTTEFPVVPKSGVTSSVKTSAKTSAKTSVKIIELLKEDPHLTLAEIAEIIGKSKRAVEMASSKLVKEQRIRYAGPQKGGHWEIVEDRDE